MKKERFMNHRKRLFLTIAMICCVIWTLPAGVSAAEEETAIESLEDVYITGFLQADAEQKLHWNYAASGAKEQDYSQERCFFLPSGADCDTVSIWFAKTQKDDSTGGITSVTETGYVMIDGLKIKSGDVIKLPSDGEFLSVTLAEGKTTKIYVKKSSNVPSMFISTASGSLEDIHADKEHKEKGDMLLLREDGTQDYKGALKHIKGRGNVTWEYNKRPYNIKLEKSADLLEMGKAKGFCLLANYLDTSLLRNKIVYDLAEETGIDFTMDSRSLDLYLNGEYKGTYLMTEKVEIDKNRVNVTDLEKATEEANGEDADLESYPAGGSGAYAVNTRKWKEIPNDPADITGGYLIEVELDERYAKEACGFVTKRGQAVTMKAPEFVSRKQIDYIADFYQDMEDALYSKTGYNAKGKRFSDYLDEESIAKMYLLQEYSLNLDSGITSFYLYKDSDLTGDGKLHMAPVWDFDVALGNHPGRDGVNLTDPEVWWANRAQIYNVGGLNLLAQAVQYDSVKKQIAEQWNDVFRPAVRSLLGKETDYKPKKLKTITEYKNELALSAEMNFMIWPETLMHLVTGVQSGADFEESVTYIERFLNAREAFMHETSKGGLAYGETSGYWRLTGIVAIDGEMKTGETLTARVEDSNATGALSYQWFADGAAIAGAVSQNYLLTDAEEGKTVSIVIRASDSNLASFLSQTAKEPVSKPEKEHFEGRKALLKSNVTKVVSTAEGVVIQFTKSESAASYDIYRNTGGAWTKIGNAKGLSFTDTAPIGGRLISYAVRAVSGNAAQYSDAEMGEGKGITLPNAPKKLKAKAQKGRQVSLSWKKVKGASSYMIYRADRKDGAYRLVRKVKKAVKFTDKKKLKKNKTYYYKIVAVKGGIYSPYGNTAKVRIKK